MIGRLGVIPVWFEKLAPNTNKGVRLVHEVAGNWRAAPAQNAATQWVAVRNQALRFEGGQNGRVEALSQRDDSIHREARSVPYDNDRAFRRLEQIDGVAEGSLRGCDCLFGKAALRSSGLCVPDREHLNLVREDQVRDAAIEDRTLAGEIDQLRMFAGVEDGLAPLGDLAEGGREIDFLKGAGAEYLGVDLAGERQHGCSVDVGVPESGQEVGRAGTCDGEASRRSSGELPVCRGRKRGCALVANAVVGKVPGLGLAPQSVRQAEVRMTHHAPDVPDAPGDHSLDHDVRDRSHVHLLLIKPHVDAVVSDLDRERTHTIIETGSLAGQGIEVPAVPRAAQQAVFDRALSEWPALMRAAIVEGTVLALEVGDADRLMAAGDGRDPALGEFVGLEDLEPNCLGSIVG